MRWASPATFILLFPLLVSPGRKTGYVYKEGPKAHSTRLLVEVVVPKFRNFGR